MIRAADYGLNISAKDASSTSAGLDSTTGFQDRFFIPFDSGRTVRVIGDLREYGKNVGPAYMDGRRLVLVNVGDKSLVEQGIYDHVLGEFSSFVGKGGRIEIQYEHKDHSHVERKEDSIVVPNFRPKRGLLNEVLSSFGLGSDSLSARVNGFYQGAINRLHVNDALLYADRVSTEVVRAENGIKRAVPRLVPKTYSIDVYDLNDPQTNAEAILVAGHKRHSTNVKPLMSASIRPGQKISVGRTHGDLRLDSMFVSGEQGEFVFQTEDSGNMPGLIYIDKGKNAPKTSLDPLNNETARDFELRKKMFVKSGERALTRGRIFAGESLRLDQYELVVRGLDRTIVNL